MSDIKPKRPVYDFHMTLHYGAALGEADALFGVRVQDKLAWPPAQVEEDDTVERFPLTASKSFDAFRAINRGRGSAVAFGENSPHIMTTMRSELIDQDDLFGGDDGAGGVYGLMTWLPGGDTQDPPEHVDLKSGFEPGGGPGHRGYSSLFFTGARKVQTVRNAIGNVIGKLGAVAPLMSTGFRWSSNDPRQPSASFRIMRIPRAAPLSDWADAAISGGAYPVSQINVLAIPGPYDTPRRNDDDEELTPGGGFPRANPAALLYEIVASGAYDADADASKVDASSFIIAARIFSMEGLGISLQDAASDGVENLVTDICEHVGATVFLHPVTGLYTIRVLRPDSVFDGMSSVWAPIPRPEKSGFVMTPSNTSLNGEIKSRVAAELVSALEVSYTIDETEETGVVTLISQRAVSASGGANTDQRDFRLFRDSAAAIKAGTRELAVLSTPAITVEVEFSREAWSLALFDIITANWPTEPALHGRRFRVAEIDYGTSGERNIVAGLIEDVFSDADRRYAQIATIEQRRTYRRAGAQVPTVDGVYVTPMPAPMLIAAGASLQDLSDMSDDGTTRSGFFAHSPRPLIAAEITNWLNGEAPPSTGISVESVPRALTRTFLPAEPVSVIGFYDLNFGAQERDVDEGDKLIFVRAVQQDASVSPHFIACAPTALTATPAPIRYVRGTAVTSLPWAIGAAALALDPDSDVFAASTGAGVAPYYREEIAEVIAVDRTTGEVTIRRGVHDTVPAPIPVGTPVYHYAAGRDAPSPGLEISGETYRTSALARSVSSNAKSRTSVAPHVAGDRFDLPARPGAVTITTGGMTAGIGGKVLVGEPADVVVSWSSRNRLLDDAAPRAWNDASITPEDGTRYYVRLWRRVRARAPFHTKYPGPANMARAWYGLTGSSFTIPVADLIADMTDPNALAPHSGDVVPSDISSGAAYVIEVGTHRGEITETVAAPASVQNALLLLDVGVTSGGYGLSYGNDYGGEGV